MRINTSLASAAVILLLFLTSCTPEKASQAEADRRKSPIAIASINHNETYIKIVYGQPYKRGREIFGQLVPYGEVWRTGANEATELIATRSIRLGEQELKAGTYSLFTIPGNEEWTIIINRDLGQWGAFDYNRDQDVFRIQVPASNDKQTSEAFTIQFSEVTGDSTSIIMEWDKTRVAIPVLFTRSVNSAT